MELPGELRRIETELRRGDLSVVGAVEAIKCFQSIHGAPWTWPEWQAESATRIEGCCRQCGVTGGPFVLQHPVELPKLGEQLYARFRSHPEVVKRETECRAVRAGVAATELPVVRKCCPKCLATTIYFRKGTGDWKCNARVTRRLVGGRCGHVFVEPGTVRALAPAQKRRIADRKQRRFDDSRYGREGMWVLAGADAVLGWFGAMREYLSLVHAVTLCNRCAFLWDMQGARPCAACGRLVHLPCPVCSAAASG